MEEIYKNLNFALERILALEISKCELEQKIKLLSHQFEISMAGHWRKTDFLDEFVNTLEERLSKLEHDKLAYMNGRIDGIGEALSILVKNLEAFKEEVRMKRKK